MKFLAKSDNQASGSPVSKSALSALFMVVFIDNLGFAIVLPYLYFYVLELGGTAFLYGVLLASYSLMSFIFTPTISRLSDSFGRRKILLFGLAMSSLSYFIFGAANMLWILFLGRMLSGTTAATVPVAQAYIADITTANQRLKYLGLLGAAAGIAFILGPAIGGTLSSLFGFAVPSFLASALAFTNLILTYFRLPEPSSFNLKRTAIGFRELLVVLRKRKMVLLLSLYFLFFVAFVFLQTALSPWLQSVFGFGSFQTGLVFFLVGGLSVFTQAALLPMLSKRLTPLSLTLLGMVAFTIGLVTLSAVANLVFLLAVIPIIAFGFGLQYVTVNTLISLNTPSYAQGGALGFTWAIAGLAQTISPVLSASVFSFGNSQGFAGLVFLFSAAISIGTLPIILAFKKIVD